MLESNLFYPIKDVKMFTLPEADLEIIKRDYYYITDLIQQGRAHELSELELTGPILKMRQQINNVLVNSTNENYKNGKLFQIIIHT